MNNTDENSKTTITAINNQPLEVVFYLYAGMTALDIIGPYDILRWLPNSTVRFVAKEPGLVKMDSQVLSLNADYTIDEINAADVLVLPGGFTTFEQMQDKEVIAWV
ncbi:MAG: DJ-1/PfpI family protein, partial [Acidobacteriota bacterium]